MAVTGRKHLSRCGKCCYYCRQVTTFLFSHIGLCTLLIGYAVMGAFTFQALELKNEERQRLEMLTIREHMIQQLWNITQESTVLNQLEWTQAAKDTLDHFEKNLLEAVLRKGYDGSDDLIRKSSQWSFSGSLLYSIIVITTIGYGNVAPRTDWGKIVTILYAIIGIPLTLFCLSSIGHAMAHSFKFIYWKCLCYLCIAPKRHRKPSQKRKSLRRRHLQVCQQIEMQPMTTHTRSGLLYMPYNQSSNWRSNKYSDYRDSTPIICNKYALNDEIMDINSRFPGPPPTPSPTPTTNPPSFHTAINSGLNHPMAKHVNSVRFFNDTGAQPLYSEQSIIPLQQQMSTGSSDESDESEDESEGTQKSIPITVCLTLVISYICGGAWFFSNSEDWTFLDASYFCFVTLSTIGFGDLVPGRTVLSTPADGQITLAICALYLLFGMALLAMSLNLVKEKVTKCVRFIGQRIGILVKDDDDYDF
ncbi:TWiK family of potassium channels protein 7-like [Oppia nitens]|uniref:TWiK family of potassium channels protein 7-like n=1 Tax=Oppia nitens TaxID=1686743 RepID=UPI0023DBB0D6|nr:TWiK family of potassium channels protein 7-like [Oppia nitens]